jgi:DNA-binding response OmpR family regulator
VTAPTTTTPIRVLLVENNPRDAQRIVQMLRDATDDFDLQRVEHLAAALDQLGRAAVDVVLLDLGLPDSQGLATVERARQGAAGEPIIALSDVDDDTIALETVRAGAQDYPSKEGSMGGGWPASFASPSSASAARFG